ncbi:MAG: hypothetical protein D3910_13075 [Candidatus Electrothrix sp. ATG2]|nr:hypothetical protein [Candidatus Electrothrix sp. ATG2]
MTFDINNFNGHEPLIEYPWRCEIDRLLKWLRGRKSYVQAFCFDVMMSAAYIDATSGFEKSIESCSHCPSPYNSHLGFINLCSPCFSQTDTWCYQKAGKPQSGALGKLSSEIILRFIEKIYPELTEVVAIGGTSSADAVLRHRSGLTILAEVKSAPLLTYPFVFQVRKSWIKGEHQKLEMTTSQLRECRSALYLHNNTVIELGKVGNRLWPFKAIVDFFTNEDNGGIISSCVSLWQEAKKAYANKDRSNRMYYLANASGSPPKLAADRDNWPKRKSISDSKTSAGMDRTDDIKKAIYQSLKIGAHIKSTPDVKTAIISNLPAYRHGEEYVAPFVDMLWGTEDDLTQIGQKTVLRAKDLRRVFDFIITLEEPILRNMEL